MEKAHIARSELDASPADAERETESRRTSAVMRVGERAVAEEPVTAGSAFIGQALEAIQAVVAARSSCCVVQPSRARMPHGFCYEAIGARPLFLRQDLSPLIQLAERWTEGVHVESAQQGARASNSIDLFGPLLDGDRAWITLRDRADVFGVIGLARAQGDGRFSPRERQKLEDLSPLLACGLRAEVGAIDAQCELAIVRALGVAHSTSLLFERDLDRVVWASSGGRAIDWSGVIAPVEKLLARSIEEWLEAQSNDEVLPTPPRLPLGVLVAASAVANETPFGARCIAVGILSPDEGQSPMALLSARERAVARLLVRGYEPANIAALTGVAEHTVRTYIRRAYKKLGVCRRADLVRRLLAPEK